ncbi:MAG TPA: hypothetical protein VK842_07840, partial [bacterium]|nr:hypothetical protein [bacterium]
QVLCVCPAPAGAAQALSFGTPLGPVPARFIPAPGPGAWGKLRWQLGLAWRLLWLRMTAPRGTVFMVQGHVACPAAWAALAGLPPRRVIYQTQNYLEPGRHRLWAFFERRLARRAGAVLCNEVNRGRFMASHYGLEKVPQTLPTALPLAWLPKPRPGARRRAAALRRLGLPSDPALRLILHQGSFAPERCGAEILEALALLPRRYHLAFTGSRPGARLDAARRAVAARPLLEGRVHFLPELPYADLLKATPHFDLGLLLYPNDGVGNFYQAPGRLTEYVGNGLAVVTSAFPGLELLLLRHGLGQACRPDSAQDIARAIATLGRRGRPSQARDSLRLRRAFEAALCYERGAPLLEGALAAAWDGGRP